MDLFPTEDGNIIWGNNIITLTFDVSRTHSVCLTGICGRNMLKTAISQRDPRPIVEVRAADTGSNDNRQPLILTAVGSKLRFVSAHTSEPVAGSGEPYRLEVMQFASYERLKPTGRPAESVDPSSSAESATAAESQDAFAGGIDREHSTADPVTSGVASCADGLTVVSVFEAFPGVSAVRAYTIVRSPRRFPIEAVSSLNLTLPLDANGANVESSRIFWGDAA